MVGVKVQNRVHSSHNKLKNTFNTRQVELQMCAKIQDRNRKANTIEFLVSDHSNVHNIRTNGETVTASVNYVL